MIHVGIVAPPTIGVKLMREIGISVGISAITRVVPQDIAVYDGAYSVTPRVTPQTLETAEKYMTKNVSVDAVPFYSVSNQAGGNTVYIAKELD